MSGTRRFPRKVVSLRNVKILVILVTGPCQRIKDQITHNVAAPVKPRPQELARGPFKRRVANVGVRPFDKNALHVNGRRRMICGGSYHVSGQIQSGELAVGGRRRILAGPLGMYGVELAVFRIVGVERERDNPGRSARAGGEIRKDFVKTQVGRERLRFLVQDVQRAALVVHEKTRRRQRRVCGLRSQGSRAAQLALEIDDALLRARKSAAREGETYIILEENRRSVFGNLRVRRVLGARDRRAGSCQR